MLGGTDVELVRAFTHWSGLGVYGGRAGRGGRGFKGLEERTCLSVDGMKSTRIKLLRKSQRSIVGG